MIVFVLFLAILALIAQYLLFKGSLDNVRGELYPDRNIAEQGEIFDLIVAISNMSKRYLPFIRAKMSLPVEIKPENKRHIEVDPIFERVTVTCSAILKRRKKTDIHVPVVIDRRGRYRLGGVTLYCGDFLGLNEEYKTFENLNEIVVPPKEYKGSDLENVVGGFMGDMSVRRFIHEDPILTVGFREYTGHEPMRMISWTQSSRGSGLMVKKYDHTMEPAASVIMCISTSGKLRDDDFETLCSMTRTVCRILEERGISYDLHTNSAIMGSFKRAEGAIVKTGLGSVHMNSVLEMLGRAAHDETVGFDRLCLNAAADGASCSRILLCVEPQDTSSPNFARLRELSGGSVLTITVPREEAAQ